MACSIPAFPPTARRCSFNSRGLLSDPAPVGDIWQALIELSEEKDWGVDYYMCCLYYLTRPRAEFQKLRGGEMPLGEIYLPSDPPRMFQVIQAARKPCLAYKIPSAGRRIDRATQVRQCFETAFNNVKPVDAVIVGMYQQFSDQVGENAAIVREICAGKVLNRK